MPLELNADQRAFVDRPGTFARLATVGRDGAPQLTVMWFRRVGDAFHMVCGPRAAKTRNIRRDPRVAIVVEHPDDPYRYLQFRGHAQLLDDPTAGAAETRALAVRYLGAERGAAYLASAGDDPIVTIVIQPERVTAFTGVNATMDGDQPGA